jgi:predicted MPP superfamily phosphohydrolase
MKNLAWVTDIHLNFLSKDQVRGFCQELLTSAPEALLITGDISEAPHIKSHLKILEENLKIPIYFVLGNHDFYFSEVKQVRSEMTSISRSSEFLKWLPAVGIVHISENTCLVGHDGWADGRFGDFHNSPVFLNDFLLISDLIVPNKEELLPMLNYLGDESAIFLEEILPRAFSKYKKVILLTHVPPFREASLYRGQISDNNYLPFFSCKAVGEVLYKVMSKNLDKEMLVLCGHTHGKGQVEILPNLQVKVGGAIYGKPQLQEIININ